MALDFWRQGLERANQPGFSHGPRWSTTSGVRRFFSSEFSACLVSTPPPDVLDSLPEEFASWNRLGQDQYLEIKTLFGPYLISSQGDRMLMANSVEGRFPFLDTAVMEFCNSLPPAYKLRGLDEKHILKQAARDWVPADIINRKKQPYRAPDAISFVDKNAPDYVGQMLAPDAVNDVGVFDAGKVQRLHHKLRQRGQATAGNALFSNIDNMAFVGILSTQLLLTQFSAGFSSGGSDLRFTTDIRHGV
jgi:asparagine synthase (glutamine-hydrolysing)